MKKLFKILAVTIITLSAAPLLVGLILKSFNDEVPPPGQMVDVGGYKLHIHCTGADTGLPTVVIETGSGEALPLFYWIQKGVSATTKVCSYDRAGLGWSEESGLPRDSKTVNEALHTLLNKAGIKRPFVFVGHSIAGLYNRDYIERYPGEVSGLVLLDPSHPRQGEVLNIDNKKFYPALANQIHTLQSMIKWGITELYNPTEAGRDYNLILEYPAEIQRQLAYISKRVTTYDAFLAEFRDFDLAALQADRNKTLGDIPFTLISAGTAQNAEDWPEELDSETITQKLMSLHTEMEGLSTNSKRAIIKEADHMSLILNRTYAEQTIPYILEVILGAETPLAY
ncbi:alpha/beta fold hydrolase [Kordiimonas pumila]|uniref:Alpha/beta fold hydrolase n=1 Tax=Kordiimonas pumila TaxID=2161677 RepID=A0ABV7D6Q6_9PROT|nr:alpha/beta hydrolase [Kordiimonas pumila]